MRLRALAVSALTYGIAMLGPGSTAVAASPANDAFRDARSLGGQYGRLPGLSLEGATSEEGEAHYGQVCGPAFPCPSMWFSWTAPASGRLVLAVSRFERNHPPLLLLYRGSRLGALTEEDASLARQSFGPVVISAIVTAASSYRIAVLGSSTAFRLSWDLHPNPCTIMGTNGPDVIRSTPRADYVCGLGGDDVVASRAGNDIVDGGSGENTVTFGKAPGPVHVEIELYEFEQQDAASSGTGSVADGWGHDSLYKVQNAVGSAFDDILVGGSASFVGSPYRSDNVFMGGRGGDVIDAGWASDRVNGGPGNDVLYPGRTTDLAPDQVIHGGPGSDTLSYGVSELMGFSRDVARDLEVDLRAGIARMCCGRMDRLVGIENVHGGPASDAIYGDRRSNILRGGSGNDVLSGGRGRDALYGNGGRDYLYGGSGIDRCVPGPDGASRGKCER